MTQDINTMTIGDVFKTDVFEEKLNKQKTKFKDIKDLRPVCRELCDLDNETIKNLYVEVAAGLCKRLSRVQREFIRALVYRALKQAIQTLKDEQEKGAENGNKRHTNTRDNQSL